jgi:hypothetical protein
MRSDDTGSQAEVWYFAYGANMASRPFADYGIAPSSREPAYAEGLELKFNLAGFPGVEPSWANVERRPGHVVHGVLYKLAPGDLALLDARESKFVYRRELVSVVGARSGPQRAHVYTSSLVLDDLVPSERYLKLLIEGAKENGLPADWLAWLEQHPRTVPTSPRFGRFIVWLHRRGVDLGLLVVTLWSVRALVARVAPSRKRGGSA